MREIKIRADIYFENIPFNVASGGFYLNLGEGWQAKHSDVIPSQVKLNRNTGLMQYLPPQVTDKGDYVFFAFASTEEYDINESCYGSMYLEKTDVYNETDGFANNQINVDVKLMASGGHQVYRVEGEEFDNPVMLKANEYIIGDVDGDGEITPNDATQVLLGTQQSPTHKFKVKNIESNFKTYFPNSLAPAAPDANCDDYITEADSVAILQYYTWLHSDTEIDENIRIGQKEFYEYFED